MRSLCDSLKARAALRRASFMLAALGFVLSSSAARSDEPATATDAAELFVELKCQLCHGVPAVGLEAKAKSAKVKGPDLGIGENTYETAEQLTAYIQREIELDGKEHKKEFKGTDEELAALVRWLVELDEQATPAADS